MPFLILNPLKVNLELLGAEIYQGLGWQSKKGGILITLLLGKVIFSKAN